MLQEVRSLGFEYAELGHGTRISLVPGIMAAVDAGEIKISSVHNFCPLPMGVTHAAPNIYQLSSERPRERELAERQTLKTMEFAVRIGAPMVIMHLGSIDMKDYTDRLLELAGNGEKDTPKYQRLCTEFEEKREQKKEPFFERVKESMKRLLPEAESRGLKLCAESRQALEELPADSDFQFLFRELTSPSLVYWHDTGHTQIKENLGFLQHTMQLETLQEWLAGFHINDVQYPGRDHCSPGTGGVDFGSLKGMVRDHHVKVLELSPSLTAEEIVSGWDHMKKVWGE